VQRAVLLNAIFQRTWINVRCLCRQYLLRLWMETVVLRCVTVAVGGGGVVWTSHILFNFWVKALYFNITNYLSHLLQPQKLTDRLYISWPICHILVWFNNIMRHCFVHQATNVGYTRLSFFEPILLAGRSNIFEDLGPNI
jgi:hypothetical protein